jgi:uncharacterized membrane protein YfcA
LLTGGVPGTVLGVVLLSTLTSHFGDDVDAWLQVAVGILLIASTGARAAPSDVRTLQESDGYSKFATAKTVQVVATGVVLGVVIGTTSVGGGGLLIVVMMLIFPISVARVVGTSIAVSLVLMLVGSLSHLSTGLIDFELAGYMTMGGVPGVLLGSRMTSRLSSRTLSRIVMLVLVIAGVSLVSAGLADIA